MRTWHKSIPMKKLHDELGLYQGVWSSQMDRYWESSDGHDSFDTKVSETNGGYGITLYDEVHVHE